MKFTIRWRPQLPVMAIAAAACGSDATAGNPPESPPPSATSLRLQTVASGLAAPLFVTSPPSDPRLFIVEQGGTIRIVQNGALLAKPFLDVSAKISAGGERGLLGLAFDPDYAANGRFVVHYTAPNGDVHVASFHVSADPDVADATSETTLFTAPHSEFANHNGGMVTFGPDGELYVAIGDGGSGGDPHGNGQSLTTLLGKLVRIDLDAGTPYAIPPDNPFASAAAPGTRGEIWSYGLRNPFRFSFDRATGDLYIGDVGQNEFEEVDVATRAAGGGRGLNFGWNVMEGTHCYASDNCNRAGLTLPVLDYGHADGACAVIGGYAYRGAAMPDLAGTYFYGDLCAGWIRSFRYAGGQVTEPLQWDALATPGLTSFGEDASGEVYVVSGAGTVSRIVAAP
ncbi:MAG TPA: PQQ-dependent sugar dehydrogenase [Gemmatimonadales bacterium]|nr:PQQ-dependent sugar dehydrogenase [Gemmatimonadales bacterium]